MTAAVCELEQGPARWSVAVHGGAGPTTSKAHAEGCERAARAAAEILAGGGSALDAVVRAVEILEDDPVFNAGTGACLDADGAITLDASIMDGRTLAGGGVCALPPFRHPVAIARAVMEKTRHVLLASDGAARFAIENGFVPADPNSMITETAKKRLADAKLRTRETSGGTVGAVARDRNGHVAAATSTGGIVDKLPGRVGDSAILGAGTYADDAHGACSTTGHGEAMIRVTLARRVVDGAHDGQSIRGSLVRELASMHARTNATGGAVAISHDGSIAVARTTPAISWAASYDADGIVPALRSSAS